MSNRKLNGHWVWPDVSRPAVPILYLDLNHFINLAKARQGMGKAPDGYVDLSEALRSAVSSRLIVIPLSAVHIWEMYHRISDPRQRRDVAKVMEELSGFQYLLGRTEIGQLEIEAGIRGVFGEPASHISWPLVRSTIGQALGAIGGLRVVNQAGEDVSEEMSSHLGRDGYDSFMAEANLTMERALLCGPSDEEAERLRADFGYAPEAASAGAESRLAFEQQLTEMLDLDPRWQRGRLRDVLLAREFTHEWLEVFDRVNSQRSEAGLPVMEAASTDMRRLIDGMPHSRVAVCLKTQLHRNARHRWSTNDIMDIDALSVAFAYCDVVFSDRAMRNLLVSSIELREIPTMLPEGPHELAEWVTALQFPKLGYDFLIGVNRTDFNRVTP